MSSPARSFRLNEDSSKAHADKPHRNARGREMFHHFEVRVNYPANIRWRCVQCAMCCKDTSKHERCIRVLPQEASRISLKTGLKLEEFLIPFTDCSPYTHVMRKLDGRCHFLQEGACLIYDLRPITCVFYPFFLNRTNSRCFRFELTPERCRGLGLGPALSKEHFRFLFTLATQRLRLGGEDLTL